MYASRLLKMLHWPLNIFLLAYTGHFWYASCELCYTSLQAFLIYVLFCLAKEKKKKRPFNILQLILCCVGHQPCGLVGQLFHSISSLLLIGAEADGALDKARKHKKRQLEDTLNLVLKKRKVMAIIWWVMLYLEFLPLYVMLLMLSHLVHSMINSVTGLNLCSLIPLKDRVTFLRKILQKQMMIYSLQKTH